MDICRPKDHKRWSRPPFWGLPERERERASVAHVMNLVEKDEEMPWDPSQVKSRVL
jgi:hypothetical protein